MATTKWGILDTEDRLWMGDGDGPALFDDEKVAQVAAMIVDVRLGQALGRSRAQKFTPRPGLRLRDEKPATMSALDAIRALEDGRAV